jgi:hypothetical protein
VLGHTGIPGNEFTDKEANYPGRRLLIHRKIPKKFEQNYNILFFLYVLNYLDALKK